MSAGDSGGRRICHLCGIAEDHFYVLSKRSECFAVNNCLIRALEIQVKALKYRAEKAEAELAKAKELLANRLRLEMNECLTKPVSES